MSDTRILPAPCQVFPWPTIAGIKDFGCRGAPKWADVEHMSGRHIALLVSSEQFVATAETKLRQEEEQLRVTESTDRFGRTKNLDEEPPIMIQSVTANFIRTEMLPEETHHQHVERDKKLEKIRQIRVRGWRVGSNARKRDQNALTIQVQPTFSILSHALLLGLDRKKQKMEKQERDAAELRVKAMEAQRELKIKMDNFARQQNFRKKQATIETLHRKAFFRAIFECGLICFLSRCRR